MQTVYIGNTLVNDIFVGSIRMDDVLEINQGIDQNVRNFALAAGINDTPIINLCINILIVIYNQSLIF